MREVNIVQNMLVNLYGYNVLVYVGSSIVVGR